MSTTYHSRAAQEAEATAYGDRSYWDYLEQTAHEHARYFRDRGDMKRACLMLTQPLSEALQGNDGP